jgi:hypothetical protein
MRKGAVGQMHLRTEAVSRLSLAECLKGSRRAQLPSNVSVEPRRTFVSTNESLRPMSAVTIESASAHGSIDAQCLP